MKSGSLSTIQDFIGMPLLWVLCFRCSHVPCDCGMGFFETPALWTERGRSQLAIFGPWKAGCFYTAIRSIPPKKNRWHEQFPQFFLDSKLWTAQIASSSHIFTNDPTFWPKNRSAFQEGLVLEFYRILVEICRPKNHGDFVDPPPLGW